MNCPYCMSDVVEYLGMSDGGGDYGAAVCEDWQCLDCGAYFEGDCIGDIMPDDDVIDVGGDGEF